MSQIAMGQNVQSYRSKRHSLLLSCNESKKPKHEKTSSGVKDLRSRRIFSPTDLAFRNDDNKKVGFVDLKSANNVEKEDLKGCSNNVSDLPESKILTRDVSAQNKSVVESSFQRKVLKVPGSNSYRRLLPFLMDMTKDDTCTFSVFPCIPKAENNGSGTAPEVFRVMENCGRSKEDRTARSYGLKSLESEEIKNYGTTLSRGDQVLDLSRTGEDTPLHGDQKGTEDGKISNGAVESTEAQAHAVPKTDEIDLGVSSKIQKSGTKSTYSSMVNGNDPKREDKGLNGVHPSENENINNHLSCETPRTDRLNLSGMDEGLYLDNKDQKCIDNGAGSNGADECAEEQIKGTPPDMGIFSNFEMNFAKNREKSKRKNAIDNDDFTCESTHKEDTCLKNGSNFKRKVALNPCSRGKIFKTPGSFSYRRLLPYLLDVSNDDTRNSQDASKHPPILKFKKNSVDKKPNIDLPVVELNCQPTEANYSSTEHIDNHLHMDPSPAIPSNAVVSDNKQTLTLGVESIGLQKPSDSQNECMKPVEQVISNIIKSLEHASGCESSTIEPASPASLSCSSGDKEIIHDGARKLSHTESISNQESKALDSMCLDQKPFRVEKDFSFENDANMSKGILKRNPRGCRGLCNCLNCSSFRLNADRAFEFSRNQMLDTEELAMNLIKELSGLRNMLKESTVNSDGQTAANFDQIMVACSKALKAEEAAKCRLKEMHSDLTVHCRSKLLERPRVKFSNHTNKMVIHDVELPADGRKQKS